MWNGQHHESSRGVGRCTVIAPLEDAVEDVEPQFVSPELGSDEAPGEDPVCQIPTKS